MHSMNYEPMDGWLTPFFLRAVSTVRLPEGDAVLPAEELRYRALSYFEPEETRVVILGQDPYHTVGKANGLAFGLHPEWAAANAKTIMHSSFGNVWKEARCESTDYSLEGWARQGVLLLNTQLSVAPGKPLSHKYVWDNVVAAILMQVRAQAPKAVWLAWGNEAQDVAEQYASPELLIRTSHPCKYSATRGKYPFVGSRCFERANELLSATGAEPIKW